MMSKLHFSKKELESSFHRLKDFISNNSKTSNKSTFLIKIYAVECGLKYLLLKERQLHSTAALDDDDAYTFYTHNLDELLLQLNLPTCFHQKNRHKSQGKESISSDELHQLYRYGGQLTKEDEQTVLEKLNNTIKHIEENLQ